MTLNGLYFVPHFQFEYIVYRLKQNKTESVNLFIRNNIMFSDSLYYSKFSKDDTYINSMQTNVESLHLIID